MATSVGKPLALRATSVDKTSITLAWTPPQVEGRKYSYKILYRPEGQVHFSKKPSKKPYLSELNYCIEGLEQGVKYEFQVQANCDGAAAVSDTFVCETKQFHDIVIMGKTGTGKSTLGNKLLNVISDLEHIYHFESDITALLPDTMPEKQRRFAQGNDADTPKDNYHSVTKDCKVLANNNSNIRVLDVPGFADSQYAQKHKISVYEANLQIIRWVVRAQQDFKLNVKHVVYFLPNRGPPEIADANLQDEIKVLYFYFGKAIFDCMTVAYTNHPRDKFQKLGFDDKDSEDTKSVFQEVLNIAITEKKINCPPVEYFGLKDDTADFVERLCRPSEKKFASPLQIKEDTCSRCACKIISSKDKHVEVVYSDGVPIPYAESKCHPCFVPKYSRLQKFAGGTAYVLTLGIGLLFGKWPGFTNSDEVCPDCKMSPGASGCITVGNEVNHSCGL